MEIKYELRTIENVQGTGRKHTFVRLQSSKALPAQCLMQLIQDSSSATSGDVKAVMSALHDLAVNELSAGRHFYLPEIGYLSLGVGNVPPEQKKNGRITGRDVFVRGINFRPEARLLKQVKSRVHFEKASETTQSVPYDEQALWNAVEAYLQRETYLTRSLMSRQFGLSLYMAAKWLQRFVSDGRLKKSGNRHQALYLLP